MDKRGLSVRAPTSEMARTVGGVCLAAMEKLEYRSQELVIHVQDDPLGRVGVDASAYGGGINVTPELLLGDPRRIPWVLSEEVAHRYLNELFGVPHGGDFLDRFAQEGFAAWFQWTWVMASGIFGLHEVVTQPVSEHTPTPRLGHDLGKHAGAGHAGSVASTERLKTWLQDPLTPISLRARVREVLDGIPTTAPAPDVAQAIAAAHAEARNRGC